MAMLKRFRTMRSEDNTGFGNNGTSNSGRFFDRKSGGANVHKRGVGILNRYSWYHTMLGMKQGKFLWLLLLIYITINLLFAGIYYAFGVEHLAGIERSHNLKQFSEVFFFSTQTFTTVGYGRISPTGFMTSAVATFEAFLGLLSFALATGLFYGRFSRPQAFLKFSDTALVSPYKTGSALMFRLAPFKNNLLSEAEVKLTLAMRVEENGKMINKFYSLDTEIANINSLSLSWTVVHPVDEKSPLYGFTEQDFYATDLEMLVFIKAFDEVFSNTVVARWSYITSEFKWGAKFNPMFHSSKDQTSTVLDISCINSYSAATLPVAVNREN